jgi:ubiquinone/menaquinone biosynthesis C-methylase UbiE
VSARPDDAGGAGARREPAPGIAGPARPATWRGFYEYEAGVYSITPEAEPAFRHRRELVMRLLRRDVGLQGRILDVGCGDGALSEALCERSLRAGHGSPQGAAAASKSASHASHAGGSGGGPWIAGTDLAARRVERARGRVPWLPVLQSSIYELPFDDRAFELVLCTDLLEHLDDPDRAVRELARVSSRHMLITVPYCITIEKTLCPHCGKDYFLYGHQHSFGREGIERLAAGAGAKVVRVEHVIPMFECRRYRWLPPLKWLIWDHFKDSGTLGALLRKR